jgi:hypothetical protein
MSSSEQLSGNLCSSDSTCCFPVTASWRLAHLYVFCKGGDDEVGGATPFSNSPLAFLELAELI